MYKVQQLIRACALGVALSSVACGGASYNEAAYSGAPAGAAMEESMPSSAYDEAGGEFDASNFDDSDEFADGETVDDICAIDPAACPAFDMHARASSPEGEMARAAERAEKAKPAQPPATETLKTRELDQEAADLGAKDDGEKVKRAKGPKRPMLIYEAYLGLAVFKTQENLDTIEEMAKKAGGYLVSRGTHNIQVRVPAPAFEGTLDAIIKLGDVHRREVKARDVTAEYHDVEIRLKNAVAVRNRLQQLLDRAANVEEALQVETQLARVTEDIERMKGRLKLLRELTAFSTITVDFTERTSKLDPRVRLPFDWLYEMGLHNLLDL